jgi:hypothetical protein
MKEFEMGKSRFKRLLYLQYGDGRFLGRIGPCLPDFRSDTKYGKKKKKERRKGGFFCGGLGVGKYVVLNRSKG